MSLNDPRWGRDSSDDEPRKDKNETAQEDQQPSNEQNQDKKPSASDTSKKGKKRASQEDSTWDDVEKMWEDVNRALQDLFRDHSKPQPKQRTKLRSRDDFSRDDLDEEDERPTTGSQTRSSSTDSRQRRPSDDGNNWHPPIPPLTPRNLGKGTRWGMGLLLGILLVGWAATGFYIVPEGQTGIVTTFGRYSDSTAPGFRWHVPMPIQDVQLVDVSSVRTAEIGASGRSDRLREALMLTDDENIVDMQFTVQYRIKPGVGARDYVFNIRQPERTVVQAAESAMREVVGRKTMDSVLFESKAEIAEAVRKSMQDMLDRYTSGIEIMSVAIQNAQPPQPVQAAFNDAVKAGQDRERSINLGEEYRNQVLPRAQGTAARLKEDALGYQARVTETARGDAARFSALFEQYQRAPEVTRDRLYIDAVKEVMSNTTTVYVDSKQGNNMLYLPLDKILQQTKQSAEEAVQRSADTPSVVSSTAQSAANDRANTDRTTNERRANSSSNDLYRLTRER